MRKWVRIIDTEFSEYQNSVGEWTLDLISIAVIRIEDDAELYLQSSEYREALTPPWVREHVIPHLTSCPFGKMHSISCAEHPVTGCPWRSHSAMRDELVQFIGTSNSEFIFWCGSYDYVLLCQLFGGMLNLPQGWPHYVVDLQQHLTMCKIADSQLPPPQEGEEHNALSDARYIKKIMEYLHKGHTNG